MENYQVFKEKAIEMRKANKSLDEIALSLNLGKTTVYYWIKDIDAHILRRPCSKASADKNRATWAKRRQDAYDQGLREYLTLSKIPFFRDFIILYICEGYKRTRHSVSIINTDPEIMRISFNIMKTLTTRTPDFQVQLHLDNDPETATKYWGNLLNIDPKYIKISFRKTSMTNRNGRLPNGILTVRYSDTYFRSRLQAWIDCVKKEWSE
jgi:hypothetical protein